ncbi:hypothetical protein J1N35_037818 [Gossypium stocksii]|uniref:Uncharacterized protein n=1 Tax=Gossypium stocksii TaxID=47602 RepID=A0A9D3ULG9_9ROSI|nr:hypothetical protein J1N35_037818 [Gossypium stocksii]
MTNLEDLLGGQVTLARQFAIINLMNSLQKPNTLVKEHMLKLMDSLRSGKPVQEKSVANLVLGPSSSKGKQKTKGKKKSTKSLVQPRVDKKKAKKSKDPKKIKCFFSNRKEHFRSNRKEYLDYLAKKRKVKREVYETIASLGGPEMGVMFRPKQ